MFKSARWRRNVAVQVMAAFLCLPKRPSPAELIRFQSWECAGLCTFLAGYTANMPTSALTDARKSAALSSAAVGALAFGATALGALAIGALAIGRLAIGRLTVRRTRIESLTIGHLTVDRLTIRKTDEHG